MTDDGTAQRLVAGRYRIRRQLGRGGMGAVWAAHDELLDREVAVKEIAPPPGLDPAERERLRERTMREARAAARIRSSAAVTVYDVVEHEGQPFVVMELLPSRSLADVLREEGPLTPADAARVGLRLLEALGAAHAAAVLHRDVKPANVLFDSRGHAVLTDFGIATLEGDPSVTTTGAIIGSPGFVAPERANGRPPTPAADLWSLGVTLASAVHGRNPFERDTALATMLAAVQDPLPAEVAEGPLGTVLAGLLQKDPAHRLAPDEARRLLEAVAADAVGTTASLPGAAAADEPAAPVAPPEPPLSAGAPTTSAGTDVAGRTQALRPVPGAHPGDADPGTEPGTDPGARRRPRALVPLLVLLGVVAAGAVALVALLGDGGGTPDVAAPATTAATAGPTGDEEEQGADEAGEGAADEPAAPEPTDPTEPTGPTAPTGQEATAGQEQPTAQAAPASPGPGLAPGLVAHEDDRYTVGVPEGWTVEQDGDARTRFRDPGSRRYLLVEEGGEPSGDPVEDWQAQEPSVAQRLGGYELIGIERADFRDFDTADWQFTWTPEGGPVRVLNRAVVDDDTDQAFALYWQVPVEEWEDSRPLFDEIAASFEPVG